MSTKPRHIIRSLAVEVNCQNPKTGRELHSQLSDTLQNRVLPDLEALFDSLGDIRLERLELNLGDLPADNWEAALREQLLNEFRKVVSLEVEKQNRSTGKTTSGKSDRPSKDAFEAYLFFLQTGRLPWWAEQHSLPEIERKIVDSRILDSPATQAALLDLLSAEPLALRRFVRQANKTIHATVWRLLVPKTSPGQPVVEREIQHLINSYFSKKTATKLYQEAVFSAAIRCRLAPEIPYQAGLAQALIQLLHAQGYVQPSLTKALQGYLDQANEKPARQTVSEAPRKRETRKEASKNNLTDEAGAANQAPAREQNSASEGIYIANSGLVLLHPFLQHFFQTLGLLENTQFAGAAEKEVAVQWLHFLATGSRECPEPELTLPKMLCTMPPENPVGRWLEPEAGQLKEAETLLNALIGHWSALKKTSPAGLREGFLMRPGKLETLADGSLKLTVERQLQDVLLEQLPWSIGIVRLPWMEQLLYVEW